MFYLPTKEGEKGVEKQTPEQEIKKKPLPQQ